MAKENGSRLYFSLPLFSPIFAWVQIYDHDFRHLIS